MRGFVRFFISALPFVFGLALTLISLLILSEVTKSDKDGLFPFILLFVAGASLALFGIRNLSSTVEGPPSKPPSS